MSWLKVRGSVWGRSISTRSLKKVPLLLAMGMYLPQWPATAAMARWWGSIPSVTATQPFTRWPSGFSSQMVSPCSIPFSAAVSLCIWTA